MSIVKLNNNGVKNATAFGNITGLGDLILIKKQTASGSASVSFVDGASSVVLDNTYKEYIFYFNNIHPSADSNQFLINFSADSGSNFNIPKTTTVFRAYHNEAGNDTAFGYVTSNDLAQDNSDQKLGTSLGADNDQGVSGYIHLFNPSSTTFVKHFIANLNVISSDDESMVFYVAGYCNSTSAINTARFKMTSGNIDSGVIKLYGIS
jgi:hypothetical protein